MNQPGGFTQRGGVITSVNVWQVYFNHAAPYEMPHMILAAYMVTGFTVAGVYAASILRGCRDRYHYTGFALGFVPAAILTPFQIFVGDTAASLAAWTSPTAILAGFLFTAACGYLAAVYLTGEAQRRGDASLQAYFTRRAQAAAIIAGALSLAAIAELHTSNPALYARLTGRALPS
jgi:cytochrome bd-type quinol oxidase subunit 1